MSGDFNSWDHGPKHAAPPAVASKFKRQDTRREHLWLAIKVGLIVAGAGAFVWFILK